MPRSKAKLPDSEHGVLVMKRTGGRPPRPIERLEYQESADILNKMDAPTIVEMMKKCGGDLDMFVGTFDRRAGKKETVLARVLFILKQQENASYWDQWQQLIECQRLARMALLEKEAADQLEKMPKPDEKTSLKDWIVYANFWSKGAEKEPVGKTKGEKPDPAKDAVLNEVKAMVEKIKGHAGGQENQQ